MHARVETDNSYRRCWRPKCPAAALGDVCIAIVNIPIDSETGMQCERPKTRPKLPRSAEVRT